MIGALLMAAELAMTSSFPSAWHSAGILHQLFTKTSKMSYHDDKTIAGNDDAALIQYENVS